MSVYRLPLRVRLTARWRFIRHKLEFSELPGVRHLGRALYLVPRWLEGARPVELAGDDEFEGRLVEGGIDIEFGGACPVQGDGTVDGREAYYRSRGEGWSLDIAKEDHSLLIDEGEAAPWTYEERPYFWPDGGWVSARVSRECIRRAVKAWREAGSP